MTKASYCEVLLIMTIVQQELSLDRISLKSGCIKNEEKVCNEKECSNVGLYSITTQDNGSLYVVNITIMCFHWIMNL